MPITFGEAKARVSQWAGRGGKCPTNDEVSSFTREVLDYMLISGQYGNQRKFIFNAVKGVFTVPYEVETILKCRIDGELANVWDRFFDMYGYGDFNDCLPANAIIEESETSPIVFDLPYPCYIGTLAFCDEDDASHLVVKGFDGSGRQVITQHNGEQVVGEYLSIKKGQLTYSTVAFGRITEVYKTRTNGYTQLLGIGPENKERFFLADYTPFEEKPQYRRFRLNTRCQPCVKVSILANIRLKSYYADNDLIPFDNLYALSVAAQGVNSNYNGDVQTAQAKDIMLQSFIKRENDTKKVNSGRPVEINHTTSGGSIKGIIF